jgi:GTP-binding protein
VSATPGKTATINFYDVDGIDLVDLPGYGYAQVSRSELVRWSDLIEGYFNQDREFALVVSLIDIRHEPAALDRSMVEFLMEADLPFAIALTKADKLSKQKAASAKARLRRELELPSETPIIVTSGQSGTGVEELRDLIAQAVGR